MATIDPTPVYVAQLLSMVHSPSNLSSKGFVQKALTQGELLKKARCKKCNKRPPKSKPRKFKPKPKPKQESEIESQTPVMSSNGPIDAPSTPPTTGPPHHPTGQQLSRPQIKIQGNCFKCNNIGHRAADCPEKKDTVMPNGGDQESPKPLSLTTRFQVHPTPPPSEHTTSTTTTTTKALAVAIDCEMGTALDGESELIRVTVLDYFSGLPLVDSLVWPDVDMAHYNTRWSGVTRGDMQRAKREGMCLLGVAAARREVWRYVGVDTVVVGHDVKNDLRALRWAHGVVVDSLLVEEAARKKEASKKPASIVEKGNGGDDDDDDDDDDDAAAAAAGSSGDSSKSLDVDAPVAVSEQGGGATQDAIKPKAPGLSLKDVSKLRLDRDIQKRTHDSFEDALASRDIVHYHAMASIFEDWLRTMIWGVQEMQ
ncbi:hypothetical protein N0V82_009425 [Gnomoniopsis sp. IMI 355080]|nr:hypothetical protein N0V82_009425 [Gnomoniopsis sp. IMI 355080]